MYIEIVIMNNRQRWEVMFCQVSQNKSWKGSFKPFSEGILNTSEAVASPLVTLSL